MILIYNIVKLNVGQNVFKSVYFSTIIFNLSIQH